jgi:plasmid stabilization system protein ParE
VKPVRLSAQAEADLEAIADFIAKDNPVRAETFVLELLQRCEALREYPFQGRRVSGLDSDFRRLAYRGYTVLYRILDDFVAIDRILHGARDIDTLLGDEPGGG